MSVILAAKRTAVVPRGGAFAALELHELAAPVITAVLAAAGLRPEEVGEVIVSNALGGGGNPARVAALAAGLPISVAGLSIDRQCAGGLDALLLADAMVRSGQHDVVVAGGIESYSRRPNRQRTFADGRAPMDYDQPAFTPWPDRDPLMPDAAEALANKLGLTRVEQDAFAVDSHARAMGADHSAEIVPIQDVVRDAYARTLTQRHCDKAKALCGSVTIANTAVAADASAFCVVVSDAVAARLGGGMKIVAGATLGDDPELPGLAPIRAVNAALAAAGLAPAELLCAEIMEAFAVQAIACVQGAGLAPEIVNRGGGALARGHPIGASGAILAVRLLHELRGSDGYGLAAIAAAGGLGTALVMKDGR